MRRMSVVTMLVGAATGVAAAAGVVIDGSADAKYGTPLAVQDTLTGFGNSDLGLTGWSNGSELDSAYAHLDIDGGFLSLLFAGNLESNFNKLEVFIDAGIGGQNQLRGDNADVDFNGLNRMGTASETEPGLKFDQDFEASFWFSATCGNTDDLFALYANAAQLFPEGGGPGAYLGTCGDGEVLVSALGIDVSINNSNVGGVAGSNGGLGSGKGVTTGLEVRIPLSLLGWTKGPIKVCVFVNGQGHDYVSNQFLGGVGGLQNLSCGGKACDYVDPRVIDLSQVEGNQYFVIGAVPPPACPSDLNNDGVTDGQDLGLVLAAWFTADPVADINDDGNVDGADLGLILAGWGNCSR